MKKKQIVLIVIFLATFHLLNAQHYQVKKEHVEYKPFDSTALEMVVYRPVVETEKSLPAIVFFFGGGWVSGSPGHFRLQAEYLASRGMIAICPDYRTKNSHGTSPFESVKDARTAMRFIKSRGSEMGIDTSRIFASGGSAGGHLAACTAFIDDINEESDDLSVSPVPFALILFNPVVDTGKLGYGQEKLNGREFEISPVHHITPGAPPTLIMHGKADTTVPYENVKRFKEVMKQEGNTFILKGYRKKQHGFFNYSRNPRYFKKTLRQTQSFIGNFITLPGENWLNEYFHSLQ